MTRIWLNHWFSTAYSIIELIKKDEKDFCIMCSNENKDSVIKLVCDEWYIESRMHSYEYVDYCLEFCKAHNIDIFLPRRGMLEISKRKNEFEKLGVKVMVEDYSIMELLNHKSKAYDYFKENNLGYVPDYYIVTNLEDFLDSYELLLEKYKKVCFKFVKDEGGKSYRLIDNSRKGYSSLFKKQNTRMTLDAVVEALKDKDEFSPIMIMPYLPGEEYSIDCLNTENGFIMLPRIKDNTKVEKIVFDEQILDMCRDIQNNIGLEYPYNIQFKYLGDIPYFLEINTRMSGGIQMACLATGVNIPNIAINKMLGKNIDWKITKKDCKIGQILLPVLLD